MFTRYSPVSCVNAKVLLTHFANLEVTHPERILVGESSLFSHREPIFHARTPLR
jgi:hypothetical protein